MTRKEIAQKLKKELPKLRKQAHKQARNRGHVMGKFKQSAIDLWQYHAQCIKCGDFMTVDQMPSGNNQNIYGAAVDLYCPERVNKPTGTIR